MPFFYHIKFVDRSHKNGYRFYSNDFENRVESSGPGPNLKQQWRVLIRTFGNSTRQLSGLFQDKYLTTHAKDSLSETASVRGGK